MDNCETPIQYLEELSLCDTMARKIITLFKQGIVTEQEAILIYMKGQNEIQNITRVSYYLSCKDKRNR